MMNLDCGRLLVRADADHQIGSGHVMRCLALAQAWRERGGEPHFVSRDLPAAIHDRIAAEGFQISLLTGQPGSAADAESTSDAARRLAARWVVADGYAFGPTWQRAVRTRGAQLLLVDDCAHWPHYDVDVLLNQNAGAAEAAYRTRSREAVLLLGSEFALLRREFCVANRGNVCAGSSEARGRRVLVTFGGSDPQNVTPRVLATLAEMHRPDLEVVAVAGGANPRLDELRAFAAKVPYELKLCENPTHMPELMNWADMAVAAAGSTAWELAYLGVPSCLVVVADNQAAVADHAARGGYAVNLGWHGDMTIGRVAGAVGDLLDDSQRRATMSRAGQAAIDGQGALRVADTLQNLTGNGRSESLRSGAA